jgi:hypothetical protein
MSDGGGPLLANPLALMTLPTFPEFRCRVSDVPETPLESPENSLANTTLTDRELLIHLMQHVEVLGQQVGEIHEGLQPLRPLLPALLAKFSKRGWLL